MLAFYLPQFHPIPENDKWWGRGFTEWTNVGKAKRYFRGHDQPKVPADLGYYDLRVAETRELQAQLACEAGVSAFCYWHYWFGNGKELLETPLKAVISSGSPDFPFCLAWANHSWEKKRWNSDVSRLSKELLIAQEYPGLEDIENHFYSLLPAFKDSRYFRLHGKLVFVIYDLLGMPDAEMFVNTWRELAVKNGLPGFYFIGHGDSVKASDPKFGLMDAVNVHSLPLVFNKTRRRRLWSWLTRVPGNVLDYAKAVRSLDQRVAKRVGFIPTIYPNWDVTPRIGVIGAVLRNSTPAKFESHVGEVIELLRDKRGDDRVIFLKSWNEWAEGNYMEPDLKNGQGYICALRNALSVSD